MAEHEPSIGASDDWYTPPDIFAALRLTFDLDPCSPGSGHWVPARKIYTKTDDGLTQPWNGLVFMNPPFGGRHGHVPWLLKFLEGQYKANAKDLERDLGRLVNYFGPQRLLSDITDSDVARLVAWRRGHHVAGNRRRALVTPSTVNRSTTEVLQRLFTRARDVWRMPLASAPIWRNHILPEPTERIREVHEDEDTALAAAMDADYEELRQLSLASGLRMAESLLRWSQVNFAASVIVRRGKGGALIYLPITPRMRSILIGRKGHHAEFVFTYAAKRAAKAARVRGQRYPITRSGLKTHWRRRKTKAGIVDLRWHDNRHDFATKLLRATGNLKLVQRALNHKKIETTTKYAHVLDSELRAGMIEAEERMQSRTMSRTKPAKAG